MALFLAGDLVIRHPGQVDELVAHVDERIALTLAAQGEIEDLRVPGQRLVDVADLDRDMIDCRRASASCWLSLMPRAPMCE